MKHPRFRKPIYINGEFHEFMEWGYDAYFHEFIAPKKVWNEEKSDEQFIGIQDINGVDIYEGDAMECWSFINEKYIGVVYYDHKGLSFRLKTNAGNLISWNNYKNIEVIGNIHQNPELLNKE